MVNYLDVEVGVKVLAAVLTVLTIAALLGFLYYLSPELIHAFQHGWVDVYILGMILTVFIVIIILGLIAVVLGVKK